MDVCDMSLEDIILAKRNTQRNARPGRRHDASFGGRDAAYSGGRRAASFGGRGAASSEGRRAASSEGRRAPSSEGRRALSSEGRRAASAGGQRAASSEGRGAANARASNRQSPAASRKYPPAQYLDARDIITSKTRQKIIDARDLLNEKLRYMDARDRLRKHTPGAPKRLGHTNGSASLLGGRNRTPQAHTLPPSVDRDRMQSSWSGRPITSYMDVDDGIDMSDTDSSDQMYIPSSRSELGMNPEDIKRTVHNEVYSLPTSMPPLPHFRTVRTVTEIPPPSRNAPRRSDSESSVDLPWSDPFQTYDRMRRTPYEPPTLPPPPARGILRNASVTSPISPSELPQLSTTLRARLERAPNPSESMGIFAKLSDNQMYTPSYTPQYQPAAPKTLTFAPASVAVATAYRMPPQAPPSPPLPPRTGYRIVVSNLHSKVVYQDIEELFGDVGDLVEARLVRPGVAEVIYRTLKEAERAVDAYHNRQLDGQPMNCLLVHPRASNKPTAPAVKFATR